MHRSEEENIEQVNTEFSHQLAQLAIAASNYNLTPQSEAIADDMTTADLEFSVIHHKLPHDIRKFRNIPPLPSCCK